MNNDDRRGLLTYFWINNEAVYFATAVFNLHPFVMTGRLSNLLLCPILNSFRICGHRHTCIRMMMRAHILRRGVPAEIEQRNHSENDRGKLFPHMLLRLQKDLEFGLELDIT